MDANGEELYKFESTVVGGAIPKEYIPAVGEGIEEAMKAGILGGFPVVGIHANVYDGSYHEVDSSEMAFHIAGSLAFKDAMRKASPILLEPIMRVEVTTPEDYMGDVIGDINSRRGRIEGMDDIGGGKMIRGFVPLSEMFGYATDLRSRTQGRGNYSMFFEKYEPVPKSVQEKILMIRGFVPLSEMFGYATDLRSRTQGRGNYSMFFEKYEPVPKSVQEKILANKE